MIRISTAFILLLAAIGLLPAHAARRCPPGVHAVVDVATEYLFGGCVNGVWVTADDDGKMALPLRGGESYRLYTPTRFLGRATGSKIRYQPLEDGPERSPSITLSQLPKTLDTAQGRVLAIGGDWNALPRVPFLQNTTQAVYIREVARLLRGHGLAKSTVRITQIWRIDLDGDGTQEVLLSAATPGYARPPFDEKVDYYSLLLLRKLVRGTVKTIPLATCYAPKGTPIYTQARYKLESVLDVNGDGVMEIVASSDEFESGLGFTIYQVSGTQIREVLSAGEGP